MNEEKGEEVKQEDEAKEEDVVPAGKELYGVVVLLAGDKKVFGVSVAEMNRRIADHGGETTSHASDASVVITTKEVVDRASSAKIRDAKGRVTMVTPEWLDALEERGDGFMSLRTKEGATPYLVEGTTWMTPIVKTKWHAAQRARSIRKTLHPPKPDSTIMEVPRLF